MSEKILIQIFEEVILKPCGGISNKPLDINLLKRIFEAGLFLIDRIKETEDEMQTTEDAQILHELNRERTRLNNSLTTLINEL